MSELAIHQLVYVHGEILCEDGFLKLVRGWGKVLYPGGQSVVVDMATGLVGDEWAEVAGARFYSDEGREELCINFGRENVFTTDEVSPGSEPEERPSHLEDVS